MLVTATREEIYNGRDEQKRKKKYADRNTLRKLKGQHKQHLKNKHRRKKHDEDKKNHIKNEQQAGKIARNPQEKKMCTDFLK